MAIPRRGWSAGPAARTAAMTAVGPREGSGTVLNHQLQVAATSYLPVNAPLLPTGEQAPVAGTPFDFRRPSRIGERIRAEHEQLPRGKGFEHNCVLDRAGAGAQDIAFAARLTEPAAEAHSRSGPPNQAWTSTPATSWTAVWSGRAAGPTGKGTRSPWNPSTSPTHRTSRTSRRPSCTRARSTAASPNTGSASGRSRTATVR